MASASTPAQPLESTGEGKAPTSDTVAERGPVETPFGAPVVRELPADLTYWRTWSRSRAWAVAQPPGGTEVGNPSRWGSSPRVNSPSGRPIPNKRRRREFATRTAVRKSGRRRMPPR